MTGFKEQLEGLRTMGKAYVFARNVPEEAFSDVADVFRSHRKKTIRARAAVPLVVLLARRAREGESWDPELDSALDVKSLATHDPHLPSIIGDACAVVAHLPEERARPLVEPHLGPGASFPTGALAFRLAGLVPLEEAAFRWLARFSGPAGDFAVR